MTKQVHPMVQVLQDDSRYSLDAYEFIRQALAYGQKVLGLGEEQFVDDDEPNPFLDDFDEEYDSDEPRLERHLTGQQLCDAIRRYALDQYGFMAKTVLNSWGIYSTGDFGEIVYNMIRVGIMKRSDDDQRQDFEGCYEFEDAFVQRFEFSAEED